MSASRIGPSQFEIVSQLARGGGRGTRGGKPPRTPHVHLSVKESRRDLDTKAITR